MSKTLTLTKLDVTATKDGKLTFEEAPPIETFSLEQLQAQIAKLTGERPLPPRPEGFQGIWDHTSMLPVSPGEKHTASPDAVAAATQLPPARHGQHSLNGIPMIASPVDASQTINPATGQPYAQAGVRAPTQIQVPPQNFGRRRG